MNPLDWATLLGTAPQLVTAVVFGFFVLKLLERQDKQNEKRDNEWRVFLLDARAQNIKAVIDVTNSLDKVVVLATASNQILAQHDTWERTEMTNERLSRAAAITASAEAVKIAAQVVASALLKADEKRAAAISEGD